MEPASLLAYKLRKLANDTSDQEQLSEAIRRLLEADRAGHMLRIDQGSAPESLPLRRLHAVD